MNFKKNLLLMLGAILVIGVFACKNADNTTDIPSDSTLVVGDTMQVTLTNNANASKLDLKKSPIEVSDTSYIAGGQKLKDNAEVKDNTVTKKEQSSEEKSPRKVTKKSVPAKSTQRTTSQTSREEEQKSIVAELAFRRNFHEYGNIMKGDTVIHKFEFTNIGEVPLVIKNATATCGCTVPSYPFSAVAPGEKGYIGVQFDSSAKKGKQTSIITVTANTVPPVWKLYLNGFVETTLE